MSLFTDYQDKLKLKQPHIKFALTIGPLLKKNESVVESQILMAYM